MMVFYNVMATVMFVMLGMVRVLGDPGGIGR